MIRWDDRFLPVLFIRKKTQEVSIFCDHMSDSLHIPESEAIYSSRAKRSLRRENYTDRVYFPEYDHYRRYTILKDTRYSTQFAVARLFFLAPADSDYGYADNDFSGF